MKILKEKGKMIAMAESCTAGLAAAFITRISGASAVFWGSFVTYTADAKSKMLGLPEELIKRHGEVSQAVAQAMAEAALEKSGSTWAFSITGLAGPAPAEASQADPPVGTVWIGYAWRGENCHSKPRSEATVYLFKGERNEVREAAAAAALEGLLKRLLTAGRF